MLVVCKGKKSSIAFFSQVVEEVAQKAELKKESISAKEAELEARQQLERAEDAEARLRSALHDAQAEHACQLADDELQVRS